jgi:ATP-binding cassette subfamily B protein AbcA/BmrA
MPQPEQEGNVHFSSFISLLRSAKLPRVFLAIAVVLSLVQTAAGLVVPIMTKGLIDRLSLGSLDAQIVLLFVGAFVLQAASGGISYYIMSYSGQKIVADLRARLWNKVLSLPIRYFDKNRSGETMSRITNDTSVIMNFIRDHLISFVSNIISVLGAVAILFYLDWVMTLIILVIVPVSLAILLPVGKQMYKISKKQQDEMAKLTAVLGQVLSEIRLVKAYGKEQREIRLGTEKIRSLFRFGLKEAKIQSVLAPFFSLVLMAALVAIMGYGGVRVASGVLSAGDLVAFILLLFQIVFPFSQFAAFFSELQKVMGATERIQNLLVLEGEAKDESLEAPPGNEPIVFENVRFSYDQEKPVLRDVSFTVPARKVTAIVGPSGSGKTTLFSLLERFYLPDSGCIRYGPEPISRFTLASWRAKIGYVSQESPLMAGTIKDNIVYGADREVTMEEIVQAAAMAYADHFIKALPQGYDTEVGERGVKLSGGQRQRITIARALLRNPDILLLDEATSSLDSTSEHEVQKALANLLRERTTIIIAHRLSTVIQSDQIVVLEKGAVTGVGTHAELLQSNQVYRQFAQKQLAGGDEAGGQGEPDA